MSRQEVHQKNKEVAGLSVTAACLWVHLPGYMHVFCIVLEEYAQSSEKPVAFPAEHPAPTAPDTPVSPAATLLLSRTLLSDVYQRGLPLSQAL